MKKVKTLKGWGIYQNNESEVNQHGFLITVLHPDNMEYPYLCSPADTDMEFDTVVAAESWVRNYSK